MKVLVIVAHPDLANSRVNKAWANAFRSREKVTVHDLTAKYPDMKIDIFEEQMMLMEHDRIVLQFPMYWYSSPPILKMWLDEVLQPGFAYSTGGDKLHGKEWVICTSIGGPIEGYRAGRHGNFTVDELLRPFQQTVNYVGSKYITPYCFYRSMIATDEEIAKSANELMSYVLDADIDPLREHEDFCNEAMKIIFERFEGEAA